MYFIVVWRLDFLSPFTEKKIFKQKKKFKNFSLSIFIAPRFFAVAFVCIEKKFYNS